MGMPTAGNETLRSHADLLRVMFSRPAMVVLLMAFVALVLARSVAGRAGWLDIGIPPATFFLFSLGEWGLHRYFWHVRPVPLFRVRIASPVSKGHADHHRMPEHVDGLFFGVSAIFLYLLVAGTISLVLLHDSPQAMTLAASLLACLLYHEWAHLVCHSDIRLSSGLWRTMKDNHAYHHTRDVEAFHAIIFPYWDVWLGTGRRERGVD